MSRLALFTRDKWKAGLVLVAILTFFGTCNYIDRLRYRAIKAEDSASLAQAQIAGLNDALAAKPKEVVKTVTVTKEVLRLVKSGDIKPVVGAKIETSTKEVPLPDCSASSGTVPFLEQDGSNDTFTSLSVSKGNLIKAETLGVQTSFNLFIGLAGNRPVWTGQAQTDLTAPNYRQAVAWSNEELVKAGSQVAFSDEVLAAIKAGQDRPGWFKRHFKVACPGFAVQYGLVNQKFDYGPTCGAAFVW